MKPISETVKRLTSHRLVGPMALALAMLILVVTELGVVEQREINSERAASVETQLTAGRMRRTLIFMESSQRGYLITARPEYLTPFREQSKELDQTLGQMEQMARGDTKQAKLLVEIVRLAKEKRAELEEGLRLEAAGKRDQAIQLIMTDLGQQVMSQISELTDEVLRQENQAYAATAGTRQRVTLYGRAGIWLLVAICVLGVLTLMRLAREKERERRVYLIQLNAERDQLDEEVSRRTAESEELARHMEQVREEERGSLARELHDELGALLTACKLDVARIRRRLQENAGNTESLLNHLSDTLDTGITLKRRIIEDLRPSALANLGLKTTLKNQCAEFSKMAEIPVEALIDDVDVPSDKALAVYRVLQEALTNIAKYANATHVRVELRHIGGQLELQIEDNGIGFHLPQAAVGSGHGLQGMRFRARACGGELHLRSVPAQGTLIRATLPLA